MNNYFIDKDNVDINYLIKKSKSIAKILAKEIKLNKRNYEITNIFK